MIIAPEVIVAPDRPIVRIREAREKVDLDSEIKKVLHAQGWTVGTYFNIQFISHDRTELLAQAEYVVTQDAERLSTNDENPFNPVTKTMHVRNAERIGKWWEKESPVETEKNTEKETDNVQQVDASAELEQGESKSRRPGRPRKDAA